MCASLGQRFVLQLLLMMEKSYQRVTRQGHPFRGLVHICQGVSCIHAMGRPQCMARSAPKLYGALDPKQGGESPLQPCLPATSPHSRVEVDGSGKELFTLWCGKLLS